MKVHNYTPCLFGLLLWKEKGKKNKSVHKIWHKSVSLSFFFFSFASQWFQVNHFVLTHPVTKSTSEVNRMHVPIEAQQHAMFIRHPKTTSARWSILQAKLICLMCRCVLCQQYAILFWPEVSFFFFLHSLSICLSVFFQASFSWVFFFFWSLIFDGRLPFLLGVKMIHYPGSILH